MSISTPFASFSTSGYTPMETRPYDFLYDPNFILPNIQEYYRHAMIATMKTAQFKICPIFEKMFSDMSNRYQIMIKHGRTKLEFFEHQNKTKGIHLHHLGFLTQADLYLYMKSPVIKITANLIPDDQGVKPMVSKERVKKKNKLVQTIYRESSAQTLPWKPKHYVIPPDNPDPELLKLDFLRNNLPVGAHEIELIKRARRKRMWETFMPEDFDEKSLEKRRNIIEAIETDQWAFREQEIEDIQNLRMQLLENMLQELYDTTADRTNQKLERMAERLHNQKEHKLKQWRLAKERELRKLYKNYKGINPRYHPVDILTEYADHTSEMYIPLKRNGVNPKWRDEVMEFTCYKPKLIGIETMDTVPFWVHCATVGELQYEYKDQRYEHGLCVRDTKWTEPVLKLLHEELCGFGQEIKVKCNLRKRIIKIEVHHETLVVKVMADWQEAQNHAAMFLEAIIRGRATQSKIYEGRDTCRELIMELQHTFPLQKTQAELIRQRRINVMNQQRKKAITQIREDNINEMLDKLQGMVAGTVLDFLNKEHRRLLDERKAHAIAMIHERERRDKESAEAGRRQIEMRRREEHDEIFKQIIKIHQETVDMYLEELVTEGVELVASEEASEYVQRIASELDTDPLHSQQIPYLEKEELISDMVHHFMIPEVEREFDRHKIRLSQAKHLKNAHETIFNYLDSKTHEPGGEEEFEDISLDVCGEAVSEPVSCVCDALQTCDPRLVDPKLFVHI